MRNRLMPKQLIMVAGLISGLLAGPAMAQMGMIQEQQVAPGNSDISWGPQIEGSHFEYHADGQAYHGYLARNANVSSPRPAVLVVHEWWGLDDYAKARTDQLAALGFVVLAVDMYGEGRTASHPQQAGEFSSQVMQNWPAASARLEAALQQLRDHPAVDEQHIAAIGYCFGGSVVMNMALSGMPLDAVISFHGSPTLAVNSPAEFNGAVQIHNGAADPLVAQSDLEAMANALADTGADLQVFNYHNATHGFTNPGADTAAEAFDLPLAYDAAADAASWQSTLLLLGKMLEQ